MIFGCLHARSVVALLQTPDVGSANDNITDFGRTVARTASHITMARLGGHALRLAMHRPQGPDQLRPGLD
jgi:hypothetical protein